jgi:hypothetical protein
MPAHETLCKCAHRIVQTLNSIAISRRSDTPLLLDKIPLKAKDKLSLYEIHNL